MWINASTDISHRYSAAGVGPRERHTVLSIAPEAPNAVARGADRGVPCGDGIVAEAVTVEPVPDVRHVPSREQGRTPQLLDGHVVHQGAHVPLVARRGVVPLRCRDQMDPPPEPLDGPLEPLDVIVHVMLPSLTGHQWSPENATVRARRPSTAIRRGPRGKPLRHRVRIPWLLPTTGRAVCCVARQRILPCDRVRPLNAIRDDLRDARRAARRRTPPCEGGR